MKNPIRGRKDTGNMLEPWNDNESEKNRASTEHVEDFLNRDISKGRINILKQSDSFWKKMNKNSEPILFQKKSKNSKVEIKNGRGAMDSLINSIKEKQNEAIG